MLAAVAGRGYRAYKGTHAKKSHRQQPVRYATGGNSPTSAQKTAAIAQAMKVVWSENEALKRSSGSEDYNFLVQSSVAWLNVEYMYGKECVEPLLQTLSDPNFDGPGARLLLGSLTNLIQTRQSYFESAMNRSYPNWTVSDNPQVPYPAGMLAAEEAAKQANITCSERLTVSLARTLQSRHSDVVIAALESCSEIGDVRLLDLCKPHMYSGDQGIKTTAITVCAELAALDSKARLFFRDYLNSEASIAEKNIAFTAFMDVFPREESKKAILEIVNDRSLAALVHSPGFLNNMLELPREDLQPTIEQLVSKFNISSLPEHTLSRLSRFNLLGPKVTFAAAETLKSKVFRPKTSAANGYFGLLVHRASSFWVGHAGIIVSPDGSRVIDVTTGRGKHAAQEISFHEWKDGKECWGIRDDSNHHHRANLYDAVYNAAKHASMRCRYDWTHLHQEGKWVKPHHGPQYWLADCVGATEHFYENAGGNVVHGGDKKPFLLPRTQRDKMHKVASC